MGVPDDADLFRSERLRGTRLVVPTEEQSCSVDGLKVVTERDGDVREDGVHLRFAAEHGFVIHPKVDAVSKSDDIHCSALKVMIERPKR